MFQTLCFADLLSGFPGRLEGCGHCFGEDRGADGVFTTYMYYTETPGGGRGGKSCRGAKFIHMSAFTKLKPKYQ